MPQRDRFLVVLQPVGEIAPSQAKVFPDSVVTRIEPDKTFYPAEAYHQDYATLHPYEPYILFNDRPKVEALKRIFPMSWKA